MAINLSFSFISEPILFPLSVGQIAMLNEKKVFVKSPNHSSASVNQICNEILVLKDLPKELNILYPIDCLEDLKIVFPYVQHSLLDFIKKFTEEEIIERVLLPLLFTIDVLHTKNIVHADLKLENIRIDDSFNIFISDFGCAKNTNKFNENKIDSLSQHKPADMTVGPSYDLYSIGVLLYQLCFGIDFMRDFQLKGRQFELIPESKKFSEKIKKFIYLATDFNAANRFKSAAQALNFLKLVDNFDKEPPRVEVYDLKNYFETYLEFMKQTFQASNHTMERFNSFIGENGANYYQRLLRWCSLPEAFVAHLKKNEDIAGIVEATIQANGIGLISTLFIRSEFRSMGYAKILENSALDFFKKNKCKKAELNVDLTNLRAITFYKKSGWKQKQESKYPNSISLEIDL